MSSFSYLIDLDGFVALGCHQKLAGVVVVKAEDVGLRAAVFCFLASEKL